MSTYLPSLGIVDNIAGSGGLDPTAVQALIDASVDTDRIARTDNIRGVAPTAAEYATPDEGDTALVYLADQTLEIWEYTGGVWALTATHEPGTTCHRAADTTTVVAPLTAAWPADGDAGQLVNLTGADIVLDPTGGDTQTTDQVAFRGFNGTLLPARITVEHISGTGGGPITISTTQGRLFHGNGGSDMLITVELLPDAFGVAPPAVLAVYAASVGAGEALSFLADHPVTGFAQGAGGQDISGSLPYTGNWNNNNNNAPSGFSFDQGTSVTFRKNGSTNAGATMSLGLIEMADTVEYSVCDLPSLLDMADHPRGVCLPMTGRTSGPMVSGDTVNVGSFTPNVTGDWTFTVTGTNPTGTAGGGLQVGNINSASAVFNGADASVSRINTGNLTETYTVPLVADVPYSLTLFAGGGMTWDNMTVSGACPPGTQTLEISQPSLATTTGSQHLIGSYTPTAPIVINSSNVVTGFDLTQASNMSIKLYVSDTAAPERQWSPSETDVDLLLASAATGGTVHAYVHVYDNAHLRINLNDAATGELNLVDVNRALSLVRAELWVTASNQNYSTTEQPTYRNWVDGKPIYEITVDCSAIANDGTLIPVGVVDTFMAIPAGSATTSTGLQVPAPYRVTSIFDALQGPDSSVYLRRTSALATPQPGDHIVLQYTKL